MKNNGVNKEKNLTVKNLVNKGLGEYVDYSNQPISHNQKKIYNDHKQFNVEMMFSPDGFESYAVCEDGLVQIKNKKLLAKTKTFFGKKGQLRTDSKGWHYYRIEFNSRLGIFNFYDRVSEFLYGKPDWINPTDPNFARSLTLGGESYIIKSPRQDNGEKYWDNYMPYSKRFARIYWDTDHQYALELAKKSMNGYLCIKQK